MQKYFSFFLKFYLFFLPWQTILITREVFVRGIKWEYATRGIYATEMIFMLCVIAFIFLFWTEWKKKPHAPFAWTHDRLVIIAVAITVLYAYANAFWAIDSDVAMQHARFLLESTILAIMLATSPVHARTLATWFIAGMTVQSALGIFQFLSQTTIASALLGVSAHPSFVPGASIVAGDAIGRWLRAYGAFPHPNIFGGYLAISIILTILLMCVASRAQRFFFLCASLLQTATLFFTFSRSAWAACLLFFFSVTAARRRVERSRLLSSLAPSVLVFLLFTVIFYPLVLTRSSYAQIHERTSITERLEGFAEAYVLFRRQWILGVGMGNYTEASHAVHSEIPIYALQPVHNVFLLMLTELGLVGLILFSLPFILLYKMNPAMRQSSFLLSIALFPILVFDHFLFSSYAGLMLASIAIGLSPLLIHNLSTPIEKEQKSSLDTILPP